MTHNVLWVLTPEQVACGIPDIMAAMPKSEALDIHFCTRDDLSQNLTGTRTLIDGLPAAEALDTAGLEHLIIPWAGIPPKTAALMQARPHLKLYNSHYNAAFVAQHAVALLLAAGHHITHIDKYFRAGDGKYHRNHRFSNLHLQGKTVLLLGYGHIGKAIETMLAGFGCKVTRLRRHADANSYGMAQRDQALAEADAIINSLPLTAETENFLDAAAFTTMKEGVVIVNVGRGKTIEETALYDALQSHEGKMRKVAAAGLDVWWRYGYNKDSPEVTPFDRLDNVVMSPHRADEGSNEEEARVRDVLATLEAILRGEARNQVEPARGY